MYDYCSFLQPKPLFVILLVQLNCLYPIICLLNIYAYTSMRLSTFFPVLKVLKSHLLNIENTIIKYKPYDKSAPKYPQV